MKKNLLKTMLLLCALIVGSESAWADDVLAYTLTPASGSNNSYASNCDIEINSITWNLSGNSQVQPWRLGGAKSATFENTDRALYSKTAISDNITKIEITHGASANITVNSMTVSVHSSAADAESGSNAVASFSPTYAANGTVTITKADATSWAGKFYRIVYNLTKTNNKNAGYVSISEAKFYKAGSSGPVQLNAPELTATAGNGSVTLEWDAISNASSYTIQYADNASFTGATTLTNATSPEEISDLTNGTTYYFKAMTVGDGTNYLSSDYGDVVSATPANVSKITITQDDITSFTNSYNWYEWIAGGVSGQAYAYKNSGMQFNSGRDGYWIYNTSAIPGTITSVKMVKASGSDRSWTLKAGTSAISTTDGGTQIGDAQTVGTSGATWAVNGSYKYFCLIVSGGSTVISSIEITYIPSTDPAISVTPASLTGFTYEVDNGPSAAQTVSVSGSNLTANITLSLGNNSDFEMSTTEGSGYTNNLTLIHTNGTVAETTVYVRLKADLTAGEKSGTITLTSTGASDASVSLSGSVTAPFVIEDGVFDFVEAAKADPLVDYGSGESTTNDGTYYNYDATTWTAVNVQMVVTGKYRWWYNGNELRLYSNNPTSAATFSVPNGYVITNIETTGGNFVNADKGELDGSTWTGAEQSVTLSISTSAVNFKTITVTYTTENQSVTISSAGWATLYTPYALDFSEVPGLTAYTASLSETTVTLNKVDDVPANTGVVLKGTAGTYEVPVIASSSTAKGDLTGNATAATDFNAFDGYNLYMLAGNSNNEAQFTKVTSGSIAAGKAFLKVSSGASVKVLNVVFNDDVVTGIEDVRSKMEDVRGEYYDLQGRRVETPTHGLYIINGKKVFFK